MGKNDKYSSFDEPEDIEAEGVPNTADLDDNTEDGLYRGDQHARVNAALARKRKKTAAPYPEEQAALSLECSRFAREHIEYLWKYLRKNFSRFVRRAGVESAQDMHQFALKGSVKIGLGAGFIKWSRFLNNVTFSAFPEIRQNKFLIYQIVIEDVMIPLLEVKEDQALALFTEEKIAALEKRVAEKYIPSQKKFLKANREVYAQAAKAPRLGLFKTKH